MGSSLLIGAFLSVLVAEIAGDKTFFFVSAAGTRYRWRNVLLGLAPAFALKMLAAVLLGGVIAGLPRQVTAIVSAAAFYYAALLLWKERGESADVQPRPRAAGGTWAAFSTVAFSEWGDPGQLAAAALAVRYGSPFVVWCGAMGAMLAKAVVALTLGASLRRHVSARVLRSAACAICLTLGTASAIQTLPRASAERLPETGRPEAPAPAGSRQPGS